MQRERFSWVVALALLALAGCGGKIEDDTDPVTSESPANADDPEEWPAGPVDGAWGTWQLLSVEGDDGARHYDPQFVELDLHPDGTAYRWVCDTAPTGSGIACPPNHRTQCLIGSVQLEGIVWRLRFDDGGGDIEEESSGDLRVNGAGPLLGGAHYRRVSAPGTGCIP